MWNKCSVNHLRRGWDEGCLHLSYNRSRLIGLRKTPLFALHSKGLCKQSMPNSIPVMAHSRRVNLLSQFSGLDSEINPDDSSILPESFGGPDAAGV